jgi:hypothetical protein
MRKQFERVWDCGEHTLNGPVFIDFHELEGDKKKSLSKW